MEFCGLYIHIPFCLRKCNYCDFISFTYNRELVEEYLLALFIEIELLSAKYNHPVLKTIYLGGGTPTCLSGEMLAEIIVRVREHFEVETTAEITCELNPATGVIAGLQTMRQAGFNRLSMGVQSFDEGILQKLGRVHSSSQVFETYAAARAAGFKSINLDLIFAIPQQSRQSWQESLKIAGELAPEHLSLYNLKIEEGTPFFEDYQQGRLIPVDEETDLWMYQEAIRTLEQLGYEHYEISNFAKPGFASKHNLRYWHYEPYLALGAGAHGFDGRIRYENAPDLLSYCKKLAQGQLPWAEVIQLTQEDRIEEFVFMGLRLLTGISLQEFSKRFGRSFFEIYAEQVDKLMRLGLIALEGDRLFLTEQGVYLGNDVFAEFLL